MRVRLAGAAVLLALASSVGQAQTLIDETFDYELTSGDTLNGVGSWTTPVWAPETDVVFEQPGIDGVGGAGSFANFGTLAQLEANADGAPTEFSAMLKAVTAGSGNRLAFETTGTSTNNDGYGIHFNVADFEGNLGFQIWGKIASNNAMPSPLEPITAMVDTVLVKGTFSRDTEAGTGSLSVSVFEDSGGGVFDSLLGTISGEDLLPVNPFGTDLAVRSNGSSVYLLDAISLKVAVAGVPGDYNGDGVVDPSDYAFWSNQYAAELGGGSGDLAADGNGDGVIDPSDYAFWSNEYAATLGGGAAVPEPTTLALLGLGGLMFARRRR